MNTADQSSPIVTESRPTRSLSKSTLFLLTGYCLLAMMLTWPTISHIATHLPGDGGDDPAIAWNLWWVKYALLNQGQTPFVSDFMFYPIGINLAFYTLTVLNGFTALPVTLNFGVVTASNLHMYFTFVVGGYGAFLLTYYLLASPSSPTLKTFTKPFTRDFHLMWLSAALAGGFYAFASNKLFYIALGQFNIGSSHWIPFTILYLFKMQDQPHRLKNAVMAGLFFTFQVWAELTYASFILVFIGLYWLYWAGVSLLWHRTAAPLRLFVRNAVVLGLIATLGLVPILAAMIPDMRTEGDFFVEGSGFADAFSADLLGFIIPTMHHPFFGDLISHTAIQNFTFGQHIYIGFVLLGLLFVALLAHYRQPRFWFWIIATTVFTLLALGPIITVNGQLTSLTGPFIILQHLPFFKGNRYPSRYSVMLMLSLSVIAGFALLWLGQKLRQRFSTKLTVSILLSLIGGLFLFEHLSLPLPQSDMRVPSLYQTIAAQPDTFTVLDIPFAWRNGFRITGALTTQFMFGQFYQTDHQKRLIQGNTSRNPEFKFQYFTQAPLINSLLALETGKTLPPDQRERDKAIAADVLRFFDIRYVVVRPYEYDLDGDGSIDVSQANVIPYIEDVLPLEKIYDETGSKLYQVIDNESAAAKLSIDTASPLAPLYFGEGWGLLTPNQPIAAQRSAVRLLLPLEPVDQQITLRMRLPDFVSDTSRTVTLNLNSWHSEPQTITQEWQAVTFSIPAEVVAADLNDVWLHFDSVSLLSETSPILDVTTLSAGEEVGDFGHIYLNGHDISPNQRGYNVAIIPPQGPPLVANFDTNADPAASAQLAQWLQSSEWPAGTIIALAVADDASANLTEEAVAALQALGGQVDLRGCYRCSHTLIHQIGDDTVTQEAYDPLNSVGLTTNLGLTEPSVAAFIDTIRVEPLPE
ncbi:MAG: hypothetical protein KDJ65_10840 [Anaerolineae bacterium]|nr:hypothetical protein [Anaerolineae bacterium]